MSGPLEQLSDAVAEQVARAAPSVVAIHLGRRHCSGIVWRPDVVVTSEQVLSSKTDLTLTGSGGETQARLAGRDASTNVAVLQLAQPLQATRPDPAPLPRVGAMALLLGADRAGAATARLALVHATGPEWHSMRGGRIDALLRLDARRAEEAAACEHVADLSAALRPHQPELRARRFSVGAFRNTPGEA